MKNLPRSLSGLAPVSVTLLRVVMGLIFLAAGFAKVFRSGFAVEMFRTRFGIPLPELFGPLVSLLELGGGALLLVGLFTRYLGVLFTIEFIVAALIVTNRRGLTGAWLEYLLLVGAFLLATHGSGALALDRPGRRWEP